MWRFRSFSLPSLTQYTKSDYKPPRHKQFLYFNVILSFPLFNAWLLFFAFKYFSDKWNETTKNSQVRREIMTVLFKLLHHEFSEYCTLCRKRIKTDWWWTVTARDKTKNRMDALNKMPSLISIYIQRHECTERIYKQPTIQTTIQPTG